MCWRMDRSRKFMMTNQQIVDILQNFIIAYDKQSGSYPENEYEGLSFYSFVCSRTINCWHECWIAALGSK